MRRGRFIEFRPRHAPRFTCHHRDRTDHDDPSANKHGDDVADWARQGLLPLPEWTALSLDQIDAFDPYLAVAMQLNPGLQITLVVGEDDVGGNPNFSRPITQSNIEFDQALQDAGYESELTIVSGGHLEPVTPGTEQFQTWVDTIVEVANGVG